MPVQGPGVRRTAHPRGWWLDVHHERVDSPHWSGKPLRIVHLSDIHSDPTPRLEPELPAVIRAEQPDVIVFTGDSINSPEGLPVFKRLLSELSTIAPTLVVRGNWDVWFWAEADLFGGTGARELANSAATISVRGVPVWFGGLSVEQEVGLGPLVRSAPPNALKVLLHHYPDEVLTAARHGVDLYLAGHTHGGQVALPFYGALITYSKFDKRFEAGPYRVDGTWAYVNRGLGMEGGTAPRVRFCARPEVTVIDVE
jgi:uncharacterized protein